jgi:hypothetical protein
MKVLNLAVPILRSRTGPSRTRRVRQTGDKMEAYAEWARFFWTAYRAADVQLALSQEPVLAALANKARDERLSDRARLRLIGVLTMSPPSSGLIERSTPISLEAMRSELVQYAAGDNRKIADLFLMYLELAGALFLARSITSVRDELCKLDKECLTRLFSKSEDQVVKSFTDRLLSDLCGLRVHADAENLLKRSASATE